MVEYASMTVENFYKKLLASSIFLRKRDIEGIVAKVLEEFPNGSELVRFQIAYERAAQLHQQVAPMRNRPAAYTGAWDGVEHRRAC
jgi:hypothetical protein